MFGSRISMVNHNVIDKLLDIGIILPVYGKPYYSTGTLQLYNVDKNTLCFITESLVETVREIIEENYNVHVFTNVHDQMILHINRPYDES